MNIQSIKYLAALAKHNHFGKAAEACFVSQPTLSMQIKKWEDRLGVQLLERSNKSMRFTPIGEAFAEHAKNILREMEIMREKAQAAKDPYSGEISLGVIPTLAPYLLPRVMPELMAISSKLSYRLIEAQTHTLLAELHQGKIDVAVLALPSVLDSQLHALALFEEVLLLAIPSTHEWAKRKSVRLSDLSDQPLFLLEEGHCLRKQLEDICIQISAKESKNFRGTSLETFRQMISAGMGMTLMPKLACRKEDGVTYLPFADKKPSRKIGLVYRKHTARTQVINAIAERINAGINQFL